MPRELELRGRCNVATDCDKVWDRHGAQGALARGGGSAGFVTSQLGEMTNCEFVAIKESPGHQEPFLALSGALSYLSNH